MDISLKAQIGFTHCYIETRNWEFTLCSRAYADEVLSSWDAGAVDYDLEEASGQRCLRLPFMAAFLVRR